MGDIAYIYNHKLYVNLTNRCPCACTFCIRTGGDALGSAGSLWLDKEPNAAEVLAALGGYDLSQYGEVIFCGYGEPLCALGTLLKVGRGLKEKAAVKIRVNTNGLGDLINQQPTVPLLKGVVDTVSISLNAPDSARYQQIVRPEFGAAAFDAMLKFAQDCKEQLPQVAFTVVDVLSPPELEACRRLARRMGIPLRVRACE